LLFRPGGPGSLIIVWCKTNNVWALQHAFTCSRCCWPAIRLQFAAIEGADCFTFSLNFSACVLATSWLFVLCRVFWKRRIGTLYARRWRIR
jgi:hypothetical protein